MRIAVFLSLAALLPRQAKSNGADIFKKKSTPAPLIEAAATICRL